MVAPMPPLSLTHKYRIGGSRLFHIVQVCTWNYLCNVLFWMLVRSVCLLPSWFASRPRVGNTSKMSSLVFCVTREDLRMKRATFSMPLMKSLKPFTNLPVYFYWLFYQIPRTLWDLGEASLKSLYAGWIQLLAWRLRSGTLMSAAVLWHRYLSHRFLNGMGVAGNGVHSSLWTWCYQNS